MIQNPSIPTPTPRHAASNKRQAYIKAFLRTAALIAPLTMSASTGHAATHSKGLNKPHVAETYTLDTNHTNIDWRISHFGFSSPSGKFTKAEGTLMLDETDPTKSEVTVTLSPANIVTGIEKLDEHLKSKDFFDVETYPTATFKSSKVVMRGKHTADIEGMLTVHGVTKPIVLHAKFNKMGPNMMDKKTVGFSADATLKRSDYGMTTYLPGLGDDVTLHIEVEANLAS